MIFASNNSSKIKEIKEIMPEYNIISLNEASINITVEENGTTYYENALLKAKAIYNLTKMPTIADDSGLEIYALNNWPGIHTKRLALNDDLVNEIILSKTKNLSDKRSQAVATLVYYDGINIISATGTLQGTIANKVYEGSGFGFDKIFMLPNNKTISMLSAEEKNLISARKKACVLLKEKLKRV